MLLIFSARALGTRIRAAPMVFIVGGQAISYCSLEVKNIDALWPLAIRVSAIIAAVVAIWSWRQWRDHPEVSGRG